MKRILLLLLTLALVTPTLAQYGNYRSEIVAIGLKMGGNLAQYRYYPDLNNFNDLEFDEFKNRINPMLGLSVEILLLREVIFISPEVLFVRRGDSRLFNSGAERFHVKVNYLETRVPIAFAIPVSDLLKPYAFVGPSFSVDLDSDISKRSVFDFGLALGLGLRFRFDLPSSSMLLKLEGGFYNGLYDTFANITYSEQVPSSNPEAFVIDYSRQNRGPEATMTIAFPLSFQSSSGFFNGATQRKNKNRRLFGF